MFDLFAGLVLGHIIAWNIWPQPAWIKQAYAKTLGYIYSKKAP